MNSEKPAIALCILKEYYPERQLEFATDLEHALKYEGRDLDDDEAYRHLLDKYNLQSEAFYSKLNDEAYKEMAYYEFALMKHGGSSGIRDANMLQSAIFRPFATYDGDDLYPDIY